MEEVEEETEQGRGGGEEKRSLDAVGVIDQLGNGVNYADD
jgi:hypothetical protein